MLSEMGFCSGIENYSRHLSGRAPGSRPYTLIDYFPKDFLTIIDESHQTIPQIRGMFNGDRSRKETLVEYGFRLPSALDNRPLRFNEFEEMMNQCVYVSATPGPYELEHTDQQVEQIIRPTGLLDPVIEVRPIKNQIDDIINEINGAIERGERVLITTLTKRMSEDLSRHLKEIGYKVTYMHSDVVIMYADTITPSMQVALDETSRRRKIQEAYNKDHGITPKTIVKGVREVINTAIAAEESLDFKELVDTENEFTKDEINEMIDALKPEMYRAAEELDFEKAAEIRDKIKDLREKKKSALL